MAKHTSAEFETQFHNFLQQMDGAHTDLMRWYGTNNMLNLGWDFIGDTFIKYYPDFDDNDRIPAVFSYLGNYDISLAWEEIDYTNGLHPRAVVKVRNWISECFGPMAHACNYFYNAHHMNTYDGWPTNLIRDECGLVTSWASTSSKVNTKEKGRAALIAMKDLWKDFSRGS